MMIVRRVSDAHRKGENDENFNFKNIQGARLDDLIC